MSGLNLRSGANREGGGGTPVTAQRSLAIAKRIAGDQPGSIGFKFGGEARRQLIEPKALLAVELGRVDRLARPVRHQDLTPVPSLARDVGPLAGIALDALVFEVAVKC